MSTDILYKDESYQIIGAAFEVYKEMGSGYLESVYQECLGLEFTDREIPFVEFKRLKLHYKSKELKQKYEPDFICFDRIVVEIKAAKSLTDEHRSQILHYLKSTNIKLGLLINFGHFPKIQYQRLANTRASSPN